MGKKKLLTLVAAAMAASQFQGQETMSLQQAQDYAVENAYSVKNSQYDKESAARQVKETISIGLPQINGSIDYQNYIDIPTQVAPADAFGFPSYLTDFLVNVSQETGVSLNAPEVDPNAISEFQFGASQTMTAGVSLSQLIFDGSYFVGLQAAKAYVNVMELGVQKAESEIRDQVAQAYHTVVMADENIAILEESAILLGKTLEEVQRMVDAGFGEDQDADQIQLTVTDLEARINYANQQKMIAMDLLKFQMGMPFETQLVLTDDLEALLGSDMDLASAPFSAMSTKDYVIQEELLNLHELNMKNERARGLPSIGAFYNYQRNAHRAEFNFLDFDRTWYPIQVWGVSLNMPIFNSLQGKHRVEKAKVEVERAKTNLDQVEQAARLEYETALNDFKFAQKNLETQSLSQELAQRIFNKTQIKYQEGVSSSMDLTQAENQLLTSQGNYINAVLQLLNAKSRLKKALSNY